MVGRAIGVRMFGAERLFVYRQRALEERPRPRKVALVPEQDGEVVEARCNVGMLGAEHLFTDRQRALAERPRARKVALRLKRPGELIEARRSIGMLRAERLFADCQCIAEQRRGLGVSRAPTEILACLDQKLGPVCNLQSSIRARVRPRKQMRRKLAA